MIDAQAISVIVATILFGPPQAAPLAMRVLESDLPQSILLISAGHLGSALILFLFFQALRPFIDRLMAHLSTLWFRIRSKEERPQRPSRTLSFGPMSPGRKYFFLASVAFVFAFGSFLGVAATQAVGMKRTRAFAAVMLGCSISVVFWVSTAYYLTKMIDPALVTLAFMVFALALVYRGKILQSRVGRELVEMGTDSFKVLALLGSRVSLSDIAEKTQIQIDQLGPIIQDLTERGFIRHSGKEIYELTRKGLRDLESLPTWIRTIIEQERDDNEGV
jgi:predicted transcriptional regulator